MNASQTNRITLYYREGSSDKVYQASIEPQGGLFVVNFAYGRRGSTMTTSTKTQTPVDYDSSRSIYDKLVREKKAKGVHGGTGWHAVSAHRQGGSRLWLSASIVEPDRRKGGQTATQRPGLGRAGKV